MTSPVILSGMIVWVTSWILKYVPGTEATISVQTPRSWPRKKSTTSKPSGFALRTDTPDLLLPWYRDHGNTWRVFLLVAFEVLLDCVKKWETLLPKSA